MRHAAGRRRRAAAMLAGALVVVLALSLLRAGLVVADWRRLVADAAASGVRIEGRTRSGDLGFLLGGALPVDAVRVSVPPGPFGPGLGLATDRVVLARPVASLFAPMLVLRGRLVVTLDASCGMPARRWLVDAGRLSLTLASRRRVVLAADRLGVGAAPGTIGIGGLDGSVAWTGVAGGDGLRLAVRLDTRGIRSPEDAVRAWLAATLTARERQGVAQAAIEDATVRWDGSEASVSGALASGTGGCAQAPSGRLLVRLGPGREDAIRRAAALGLLPPGEAQAVLGVLALLGPADATIRLPVAVEDGVVAFDGLRLGRLP